MIEQSLELPTGEIVSKSDYVWMSYDTLGFDDTLYRAVVENIHQLTDGSYRINVRRKPSNMTWMCLPQNVFVTPPKGRKTSLE